MAKVTLPNIGSAYGSVGRLNANFDAIEAGFDNTLSRDGTSPNQMEADLDMNSNAILNVSTVHAGSVVLGGTTLEAGNAVSAATVQVFEFVATAGQTTFSVAPLTPTSSSIIVEVNGVVIPVSTITTSSTSVILPALQLGDEVVIRAFTRDVGGVPAGIVTYAALANSSGSSLVGHIGSGTGAVTRTVRDKMREWVSVKDFGAVGDGVTDDTAAIQAAINHAATRALVGGTVYLPPGSYKTTSTIYTYGSGGVGQVALVGSGLFSTRFMPSGDFTVLKLVTSYMETGGFSIEWPVTVAASIPSARIGVELADANWQFSYATLKNVTVNYAYRGFVLNDWTGQPFGTAYLCTLQQLTAFRCADWGFYLNSKSGSTTLRMIHCYVRGDDSGGSGAYGKGVLTNNFNDIYTEQLAIDQCLNSWISHTNFNVCVANGTALEANKMSSAAATAVLFNGAQVVINGFKDIECTYNTGGNARVIYGGGNCILTLAGYNEQYSTVVAGTTKYKLAFNAVGADISILDNTILPANVLDNGWFASVSYQGVRRTSIGIAPNYGTWSKGTLVKNGLPAVGQPKGWVCTVAGTPGTWVSEGNL